MLRAVWVRGPWAGSPCWDTPGTASWQHLPGSAPLGQGGAAGGAKLWSLDRQHGHFSSVPRGGARAFLLLDLSFLAHGGVCTHPRRCQG